MGPWAISGATTCYKLESNYQVKVISERQGGLDSSAKGTRLGVTGGPSRGRKGVVAAMRGASEGRDL